MLGDPSGPLRLAAHLQAAQVVLGAVNRQETTEGVLLMTAG